MYTAASETPDTKPHNYALVSSKKMKLSERDLLKMCIDNPKYLSKTLGHEEGEGTGLENLQQKKEMLTYLNRAWSGLTKYIHS